MLVTTQDSKEADKERMNRLRERLMYRALNQIGGWKEAALVAAINRQQQEDKLERARKQEDEEQKRKHRRLLQTNDDIFTLRCFKCDSFCCFSNEVLCRDTHYFVGSDSLRDRVDIHLHPKPQRISGFDGELYKKMKMFCKKCNYEWGIVALFRDIKLPIIKIESFFIYNKDGVKSHVKKWKNVPFVSRALTDDDIYEFTARPILDDK
jgi:ATP-dependent RNA helicase DDX58